MAVRGMERFLKHFEDSKSSFAVIGGCACSQWCAESDVRYRSTQDIDMVLILESKTSKFFGFLPFEVTINYKGALHDLHG